MNLDPGVRSLQASFQDSILVIVGSAMLIDGLGSGLSLSTLRFMECMLGLAYWDLHFQPS